MNSGGPAGPPSFTNAQAVLTVLEITGASAHADDTDDFEKTVTPGPFEDDGFADDF